MTVLFKVNFHKAVLKRMFENLITLSTEDEDSCELNFTFLLLLQLVPVVRATDLDHDVLTLGNPRMYCV